jgi:hypothetical protein
MEPISLTSKIPTGAWTLYFHSPGEKKWSIDTFITIGTVQTWGDFWVLVDSLDESKWSRGMFFWMRGTIPPLWENFQNIKGGSYSICQGAKDSIDIYNRYTAACMAGIATTEDDLIQGTTISPKKGFHVIKLWNKDANLFNKSTGLRILDTRLLASEVRYMPHVEKKM